MPRLAPKFLRKASQTHYCLPLLLPECRTVDSARIELRWLSEFVAEKSRERGGALDGVRQEEILQELCRIRGKGKPLQYILGSQPFGELDILCRRGVLIPRCIFRTLFESSPCTVVLRGGDKVFFFPSWRLTETRRAETEHYTTHLASLIASHIPHRINKNLNILDLCTGTGCIPLLLYSLLSRSGYDIAARGIDISPHALSLARRNLVHNFPSGDVVVEFVRADVFSGNEMTSGTGDRQWDVVISNPPYISPSSYAHSTTRSVRNFEPKLALVPPTPSASFVHPGDTFYPRISQLAVKLGSSAVMAEVEGWEQARRVLELWRDQWAGVTIWQDYAGHGRIVVAWMDGWEWMENGPEVLHVNGEEGR
ncbi:hypothetical protein RUND412_006270 [Rhizina undulata]